ncbi:hypothetical protein FA15DRAFT_656754 [Coprinopsis marcescibilis]|uniref:Uncharacterized protein n=1 Tax=Coprinopsis marcescibilis TaxID=230819 RepID=A0A5C3L5C4_COPMA|nr:hypothetical protein FA15DRAFT_656754 [Coprinopsis marcescibilis]
MQQFAQISDEYKSYVVYCQQNGYEPSSFAQFLELQFVRVLARALVRVLGSPAHSAGRLPDVLKGSMKGSKQGRGRGSYSPFGFCDNVQIRITGSCCSLRHREFTSPAADLHLNFIEAAEMHRAKGNGITICENLSLGAFAAFPLFLTPKLLKWLHHLPMPPQNTRTKKIQTRDLQPVSRDAMGLAFATPIKRKRGKVSHRPAGTLGYLAQDKKRRLFGQFNAIVKHIQGEVESAATGDPNNELLITLEQENTSVGDRDGSPGTREDTPAETLESNRPTPDSPSTTASTIGKPKRPKLLLNLERSTTLMSDT